MKEDLAGIFFCFLLTFLIAVDLYLFAVCVQTLLLLHLFILQGKPSNNTPFASE